MDHFAKRGFQSSACPQSLRDHPCRPCIPAPLLSRVYVHPNMPFPVRNLHGKHCFHWEGDSAVGPRDAVGRIYLSSNSTVRCWRSNIQAALQLMGYWAFLLLLFGSLLCVIIWKYSIRFQIFHCLFLRMIWLSAQCLQNSFVEEMSYLCFKTYRWSNSIYITGI